MSRRNGKGAALTPDPKNARRHGERNKSLIRESLQTVGPLRSIGVDGNNIIRAGNGVYDQAQALGLKVRVVDAAPDELIAVRRQDLKGKKAIEAALFDNRAGEVESTWNTDILAEIAERDGDLLRRMFEGDRDVLAAIGPQEQADAEPQIDRAGELNKKWKVKMGDLWRIGEHRLLCGDSTRREDVERVMPENRCNLIVTDPPYNLHYHGGGFSIRNIKQEFKDKLEPLTNFDPREFIKSLDEIFFGAAFIFSGKETLPDYVAWIAERKLYFNMFVWCKQNPPPFTKFTFLPDIEYVVFAGTDKRDCVNHLEYDDYHKFYLSEIHEGKSEGDNLHPTIKPIKFIERLIKVNCNLDGIVFDPFVGSGTTIVACQNLRRKCRAIEISPAYCAVTLERMATAFPGIEIERLDASTQKPKAHRKRTQTAAA